MKTDLRFTDTNAASDSKGRTWGLEGGLFWWLVGGIGAGITVFFVLLVMMKSSLLTAFVVALVPVGLCLAYIFGLRQGKPPGYDRDCFEQWFSGSGFAPEETIRILTHPLAKNRTMNAGAQFCGSITRHRFERRLCVQNLHLHGLDATARAHMERALAHIRGGYIARNESARPASVWQLVETWTKAHAHWTNTGPTRAPNKSSAAE